MASALQARQLQIALVVASYFVVSIALVFVNKVLLTEGSSIPAPLFVTWFQCLVTVAICWVCGELGATARPGTFFAQFPRFRYDVTVARKLLPLSVIFVGMITFNNLSLKYVEVSFYNVARSLTLVFNVVFTYLFLGERTSGSTLACLAAVITGFFMGSTGEVNFSLLGTAFGVTSSVFVSLNSIWTKRSMSLVDGNQWLLAGYNNVNAAIMFIPLMIATGEMGIIRANSRLLTDGLFWLIMTVGGVFGFLIGIVTIMQIKVTSPLTHNISGTAKACVQTVLAVMIWRNPTTVAGNLGVALVLLGSAVYTYVRGQEMAAEAERKARAKADAEAAAAARLESGSGSSDPAGAEESENARLLSGGGNSGSGNGLKDASA